MRFFTRIIFCTLCTAGPTSRRRWIGAIAEGVWESKPPSGLEELEEIEKIEEQEEEQEDQEMNIL